MFSALGCTHNTYPPKAWIFPRAMGKWAKQGSPSSLWLSLTCASPPCWVVGVQLLQVGGTAVCFDCLCTSGIPATQLTLQDENGIYALINSPYFFVRGKKRRGGIPPTTLLAACHCSQHTTVANVFQILPCVEMETIRKILGWYEDFPNTCLPPLMPGFCKACSIFFCSLVHFHLEAHVYFISVCVHTSWWFSCKCPTCGEATQRSQSCRWN